MKESYAFIPALPTDNPSEEAEDYIKGILENADEITVQRLIYGNFEYDDDLCKLMSYERILDMFKPDNIGTLDNQRHGERVHIVVDAARYGKDKAIIGVFKGRHCFKIIEFGQSSMTLLKAEVEALCIINKVSKSRVIVDEDGVGGGLVDMLGCVGFVNNSRPLNGDNFNHLKSQCYFYLADLVNNGKLFVSCTSEQQTNIVEELEVVRIHNADKDGKRAIEPKDKVKEKIGRSPDYSDMLAMWCWFEIYSGVGMEDAR